MLLLQNAHALQTLRQWACASRRRRGANHVELNAAQVRRHAAHKRRHNAVESYDARLEPKELTDKNAYHYCPTICAIQKKKLLNHKGVGAPRPLGDRSVPPLKEDMALSNLFADQNE